MDKQRKLILAIVGLVVVFAAAFGLSFTGRKNDPPEANKVQLASAERDQQACASGATYGRLKEVLFEDALKIGNSDPKNLDTLATHSVVRMENPVVKSRDEDLNVTVCSGTFVLELPPGAERAFGGERRLAAQIDYNAQPAADGSGLVYQINGAERIISQLADFDVKSRGFTPPTEPEVQLAEADTAPPPYSGPAVGGPFEEPDGQQPAVAPVLAPAPRASAEADQAQRQQRAAESRSEARERQAEARQRALAERRAEARKEAEQRRLAEARTERAQKARAERPDGKAKARALARSEGQRIRPAADRPSFNCRSARTRSERMVCDNRALAARDRQMSSQFYSALADADPQTRRQLRRTRDRFLAYRERCRSEECVADAYEGRMAEIDDIMTSR